MALHACLTLWLTFYIVYVPIHLHFKPHTNEVDAWMPVRSAPCCLVPHECHNGDGHHQQHPAVHYELRVTQPGRAPLAELPTAHPLRWVGTERACLRPQVPAPGELSPLELSQGWRFVVRAALSPRAPSSLS